MRGPCPHPCLRRGLALLTLHAAPSPDAMNQPGFNFHRLTGTRTGVYTVHVNGPWCITFEWDGTDAIRADFEQYH